MSEVEAKKYIVMQLNDEKYGINIKYIENIIVMQSITRVPKAQPYYKGVINLRGDIVPVMSLRIKLGLEPDVFTGTSRIIIVKPEGQDAVGIIVDKVLEVVSLPDSDIDKLTYDEKDEKANFSKGIGKYGDDLINLLNVTGIIFDKETKEGNS